MDQTTKRHIWIIGSALGWGVVAIGVAHRLDISPLWFVMPLGVALGVLSHAIFPEGNPGPHD